MVNTTWGPCPCSRWRSRPIRRLNVWSVPPSSTSARTATESIPWSSGYRNSITEMGRPSAYRLAKSSRSSIRATVAAAVMRSTASMSMASSHSELYRTSVASLSRISQNCSRSRSAYPRTTSAVSRGRVSDFPLGSPTRAVKSPTMSTAVCPASWKCRSFRSTTHPKVTAGAVGSRPSLTRRDRPVTSLARNSSEGTTSAAPDNSRSSTGEVMPKAEATSGSERGRYHGRTVNGRRGSLVAGLLILATLGSACHLPDVPNLDDEERKARALPQTSFLLAGDGTLITTFHAEENREIVPLDDIPLIVRRAVVAVEDRRFYSHSGVDFRALVRAAYAGEPLRHRIGLPVDEPSRGRRAGDSGGRAKHTVCETFARLHRARARSSRRCG